MTTRRATYRLQLSSTFTFDDAVAVVPYLARLGVSHLYLSPILEAAEGSAHGYDVVDPEHVASALGGDDGLDRLVAAARAAGVAMIVDIVPNHMSIASRRNRWWLDVLENGRASAYAHFFDVDWGGDDRIVLPILAERYGRALTGGRLGVVRDANGRYAVRADEALLPLSPSALGVIVRRAGEQVGHAELAFIGDTLAQLPAPLLHEDDARQRRHRDKLVLAERLAALVAEPALARALDAQLATINSDASELDAVLERQAYRLAHWSIAGSELGYRRFFDIATLVGIRNEDDDVFDAVHARVVRLVASGAFDGVRVDHVDGLRDPTAYLARLRAKLGARAWIVVEKILCSDEQIAADWPVEGTTGYEHMERVGALLVDPAAERPLTRLFEEMTGETWDPGAASRSARLEVLADALHSELARLTEIALRACRVSPACRDFTRAEVETALAEIIAGYTTYRTYVRPGRVDDDRDARELDRERIAAAVAAALDARPELERDLLGFLEEAASGELAGDDALELAARLQQVTGAVIAKGDEDTVMYRQVRLASRCEVGAELRCFARDPTAVHAWLARGAPHALLATSTHDSKRGEDVRARIAALSELSEEWATCVRRWSARMAPAWRVAPDRVLEYQLWQDLVGAWPVTLERAREHARKSAREARRRTSWRRPDEPFEAAVDLVLEAIYGDRDLIDDVDRFVARLRPHGDRNSLAQLLIKLCAPGVPDFYQGCELRGDNLVDPDNRRPVDWQRGRDVAQSLADSSAREVLATGDLGAAKLWTIRRVLAFRTREPDHFAAGYRAVDATGPHAHRVFAFMRGDELVAVAPRLAARADGFTATTLALPDGRWRDVLTDRTVVGGGTAVGELLGTFPIALYRRL